MENRKRVGNGCMCAENNNSSTESKNEESKIADHKTMECVSADRRNADCDIVDRRTAEC